MCNAGTIHDTHANLMDIHKSFPVSTHLYIVFHCIPAGESFLTSQICGYQEILAAGFFDALEKLIAKAHTIFQAAAIFIRALI